LIAGLTGGYCSGKSAAASMLERRGWVNIEVDAMGHRALEACIGEVEALLGPGARRPDGSPDRRAIGARVFADPALMLRYEAIVHPVMNRLTDEAIAEVEGEPPGLALVNAALLYRLPQAARCAFILELRSCLPLRVLRGMRRDGLPACAALARIVAQRPLREAGKAFVDRTRVVRNDGSPRSLERSLERALRQGTPEPRPY